MLYEYYKNHAGIRSCKTFILLLLHLSWLKLRTPSLCPNHLPCGKGFLHCVLENKEKERLYKVCRYCSPDCHYGESFPFQGKDNTEAALKLYTTQFHFLPISRKKQSLVNEALHGVSISLMLDQPTGVIWWKKKVKHCILLPNFNLSTHLKGTP